MCHRCNTTDVDKTAVSDDSIESEIRSPESSDGDDSFIVSDEDSPVATAQLGYNYLDTDPIPVYPSLDGDILPEGKVYDISGAYF